MRHHKATRKSQSCTRQVMRQQQRQWLTLADANLPFFLIELVKCAAQFVGVVIFSSSGSAASSTYQAGTTVSWRGWTLLKALGWAYNAWHEPYAFMLKDLSEHCNCLSMPTQSSGS